MLNLEELKEIIESLDKEELEKFFEILGERVEKRLQELNQPNPLERILEEVSSFKENEIIKNNLSEESQKKIIFNLLVEKILFLKDSNILKIFQEELEKVLKELSEV